MATKRKKRSSGKAFRFQLSLAGIAGVAIVCFCLFLWMFLLGVWAGQTILLPAARPEVNGRTDKSTGQDKPLLPKAKIRAIAPAEKK